MAGDDDEDAAFRHIDSLAPVSVPETLPPLIVAPNATKTSSSDLGLTYAVDYTYAPVAYAQPTPASSALPKTSAQQPASSVLSRFSSLNLLNYVYHLWYTPTNGGAPIAVQQQQPYFSSPGSGWGTGSRLPPQQQPYNSYNIQNPGLRNGIEIRQDTCTIITLPC
jgi:hypothetical protein